MVGKPTVDIDHSATTTQRPHDGGSVPPPAGREWHRHRTPAAGPTATCRDRGFPGAVKAALPRMDSDSMVNALVTNDSN